MAIEGCQQDIFMRPNIHTLSLDRSTNMINSMDYCVSKSLHHISNSKYLVRNPIQAALQSNIRLKVKHFFEYFWLGMTLRPKGSRNLF